MSLMELHLLAGLAILGMMIVLWLGSLPLKNASIIDVFWGIGFVVVAWLGFVMTPHGSTARRLLLCTLVTIWGLRLALHILLRNWGTGEDFRYRAWRESGGNSWWWQSLFKVFLLQGVILWIVAVPLVAAQFSPLPKSLTVLDYLGAVVWLVGFFFEAVGDWQLVRFKRDPANRGRLLRDGLWRYTRHPNYFGDAVQWWGFYLIAAAAGAYWTAFSPIVMTLLLLYVSGVAMLEESLKDRKPGYREYAASTNAFIPWFPRN